MFTHIERPSIVIYDAENNKLIGTATFEFTPQAEQELLGLVEDGVKPSSLTLLNLNLYQTEKNYVPPSDPYKAYNREGTINASLKDSITGKDVPVEIKLKFKLRARGVPNGNSYYFHSAEFGDIEIESIKIIY